MLCPVSMRPGRQTGSRWVVVRALVISVGLLALVGLYLSGGLDRVAPPEMPAMKPGAVVEAEPWNVTITSVRVRNAGPPTLSEPGNRWIEVLATVEVTTDSSNDVLIHWAVSVSGIDGLTDKDPDVRLVRDGETVIYLHPDLPEQVIFYWEQSGDAAVPNEVDVAVVGMTHRRDTVNGLLQWKDPYVRARVRLPVEGAS
jgi:hypothetical protein